MMTILNTLRTAPQKIGKLDVAAMAALPDAGDQDARGVAVLPRESVLDVRLAASDSATCAASIRQYGRTQDQVFPVGNLLQGRQSTVRTSISR